MWSTDRNNFSVDFFAELRHQCLLEARHKFKALEAGIEKLRFSHERKIQMDYGNDVLQEINSSSQFIPVPTGRGSNERKSVKEANGEEFTRLQEDIDNNFPPPLGFDLLEDPEMSQTIEGQGNCESRISADSLDNCSIGKANMNEEKAKEETVQILGLANSNPITLHFSHSDVVGCGSTSTVFSGFLYRQDSQSQDPKNSTGVPVAIKKMRLPYTPRVLRSLYLMVDSPFSTLTSPYLLESFHIDIKGVDVSDKKGPVLLVSAVSPLATSGSVYDWLVKKERLIEKEIREVAQAILIALETLHSIGVVHNDVKPQNVFVFMEKEVKTNEESTEITQTSMLKLGDFTSLSTASPISKILEELHSPESERKLLLENLGPSIPLGTGMYMSPEACLGCADSTGNDLWSLGITLFQLATGHAPWTPMESANPFMILNGFRSKFASGDLFPFQCERTSKIMEVENYHESGKASFNDLCEKSFGAIVDEINDPLLFSTEFSEIVNACLKENPAERPSAKSLLKHPFFEKNF